MSSWSLAAHAVAQCTQPRYTADLDIFLDRSVEIIRRLGQAMKAFGLPINEAELEKMTSERRVMITLGHEPNRVDLLNFLTGISFQEAWSRKVYRRICATEAAHICRTDLIIAKKALGRPRDLLDAESLERRPDP